jgi:hypothetical protein
LNLSFAPPWPDLPKPAKIRDACYSNKIILPGLPVFRCGRARIPAGAGGLPCHGATPKTRMDPVAVAGEAA